ncbi:hypothetical protein C809_04732, partial [Lachnospiraceae bacterium MD335]
FISNLDFPIDMAQKDVNNAYNFLIFVSFLDNILFLTVEKR